MNKESHFIDETVEIDPMNKPTNCPVCNNEDLTEDDAYPAQRDVGIMSAFRGGLSCCECGWFGEYEGGDS